jgi:predicted nuclease of predicted toxin-antitoxin system
MRILLDESLPRRLSRALPDHSVSTVVEAGWSGVKNGRLLTLAAARFDVFITADQNLQYQQNIAALPLAVIVLAAHDNRLPTLLPLVPDLPACLERLTPNSLMRVGV